jgi:hypothetical protein
MRVFWHVLFTLPLNTPTAILVAPESLLIRLVRDVNVENLSYQTVRTVNRYNLLKQTLAVSFYTTHSRLH